MDRSTGLFTSCGTTYCSSGLKPNFCFNCLISSAANKRMSELAQQNLGIYAAFKNSRSSGLPCVFSSPWNLEPKPNSKNARQHDIMARAHTRWSGKNSPIVVRILMMDGLSVTALAFSMAFSISARS